MNRFQIKKVVALASGVVILYGAVFFSYEYATEPKIVDGVLSKGIDAKGNPVNMTNEFTREDTIYFSAKQNRFWIKKAKIVWYKGEIKTKNRIYEEEEVKVNKAGYFSAKLSVPNGLEEGLYGVTIFVDGSQIMEIKAEFNIKE